MASSPSPLSAPAAPRSCLWRPRQVLITRAARGFGHGRAMAERAAALGAEVVELAGDRLNLPKDLDPRAAYRAAKATLAVVVAPPSKRRLQPIPPSADWRFDLAEGCHAHCQYCYLAGSLAGPPITRAYANVDEILAVLPEHLGGGSVTSASPERAHEGTTFEASCYADPLGIEHVTGSLSEAVRFFGRWDAPVQLRFTSKFGDVSSLIGLPHGRRVRVRMSVNAEALIRYEGGTSPLQARLDALGRLARDGYRVGLTVAPIQPFADSPAGYDDLFARAAASLAGIPDLDLTAELITHRFTPASKTVLQGWYPGSDLDLDEAARTRKLTKFGSTKFVYPIETMRSLRASLQDMLQRHLPAARILYWT
ncbi:Spore photoproduct lyase [Methylobacterium adhaesivum]|uniref:Radical SAM protein n=1 Tax=Methylobacterium adhaesivum TaxID=333297 RepID=A0ABT8BFN3_9HYPH|nr:radical SAM protein [Methylobacterium adhaesivum]MDN3590929.1 radical SAM protein [Methylobacterium adhaesivum]GJD29683.1 Spore photoproduct lyase [Methylobacterium adhaesivum]